MSSLILFGNKILDKTSREKKMQNEKWNLKTRQIKMNIKFYISVCAMYLNN